MSPQIKAVIDVGTNSVKLLVAEVAGRQVLPLVETSQQTRLGRGFYKTHRLQKAAINDTSVSIHAFMGKARELGAASIRVLATSAVREAVNAGELVLAVKYLCGTDLEIVSGDEEAELVYQGVQSGVEDDQGTLMIVDVGGGSTEVIVGAGRHPDFFRSYQIGTVRLMDKFHQSDPPTPSELTEVREYLSLFFRSNLGSDLKKQGLGGKGLRLIGTGGTTTLLARMHNQTTGYDRELIESTSITRGDLGKWMARLWGMGECDRKMIVGLPPEKADVILMGGAIYESILEVVPCEVIQVSLRGIRFGALLAGDCL